ncbi:hypothetical protein [Pseudobacteriovorax antillogorgiicola]|nr:hypothetical protein [Pseudobacteriovorax antillogorgiicola]
MISLAPFSFSGSLKRVVLVLDREESQGFGVVPLAVEGLKKAERQFNIFYQIVETDAANRYEATLQGLALKGFDLMIGVGPRANDSLCDLAFLHSHIHVSHVSLIEGACDKGRNVSLLKFDQDAMSQAFQQFIRTARQSKEPRFAWIEEQSDPQALEIQKQVIQGLRGDKPAPTIEVYDLDQDLFSPLSARVQSGTYDGVILMANPELQRRWLEQWSRDVPLMLSGKGAGGAAFRLVKRTDELVFREIGKLVTDRVLARETVYGFADGALELKFPEGKARISKDVRQAFDVVIRPRNPRLDTATE